LLNLLQPLPFKQSVVVSLNLVSPIAREHVLGEFDYAHPVFDPPFARGSELPCRPAQHLLLRRFHGYGFHEDGLNQPGCAFAQKNSGRRC
jgi:predicted NAD/FAD-binding protein